MKHTITSSERKSKHEHSLAIISTRAWNQNQSWNFERTVKVDDFIKLRVRIDRNAYDHQSYGQVERWNGTQWRQVVHVPITVLECRKFGYFDKGVTAANFEKDCAMLLDEALQITGGE